MSFFITVLVVRVGCIIEAYPAPNNGNGYNFLHPELYEDEQHDVELETAASHSFIASPVNSLVNGERSDSISRKQQQPPTSLHQIGGFDKTSQPHSLVDESGAVLTSKRKSLIEATTTALVAPPAIVARSKQQQQEMTHFINPSQNDGDSGNIGEENDETCSGKTDGYYQGLGSGCTSYYFCAAGYQATYVCPIGFKFNGKRCEKDYVCPTTTRDGHHISNDCENKSNGYYPANSRVNVGKYFYCFQKAKVIELQCDSGKIFVKDKCIHASSTNTASLDQGMDRGVAEISAVREMNEQANSREATAAADTTCSVKSNGFYQDLESHCEKYYYCIGGDKTELRCQDEYVFNGDICVHHSRYECPHAFVKNGDESQHAQSELKLGGVGSIDQGISTNVSSAGASSGMTSSSSDSITATATEAGKLPIIREELSSLGNDYHSGRNSSDGGMSTTAINSSHINAS